MGLSQKRSDNYPLLFWLINRFQLDNFPEAQLTNDFAFDKIELS